MIPHTELDSWMPGLGSILYQSRRLADRYEGLSTQLARGGGRGESIIDAVMGRRTPGAVQRDDPDAVVYGPGVNQFKRTWRRVLGGDEPTAAFLAYAVEVIARTGGQTMTADEIRALLVGVRNAANDLTDEMETSAATLRGSGLQGPHVTPAETMGIRARLDAYVTAARAV